MEEAEEGQSHKEEGLVIKAAQAHSIPVELAEEGGPVVVEAIMEEEEVEAEAEDPRSYRTLLTMTHPNLSLQMDYAHV